MKKKTTFLLMLLMCLCSGAWGATVFSADVTATKKKTVAAGETLDMSSYATIVGGTMTAINGESSGKDMIGKQGVNQMCSLTANATVFKVELINPLAIGDVISANTYSRKDANLAIWVTTAATRPASCSTSLTIGTKETPAYEAFSTYTVTAGDGLVGARTIYIYRGVNKSVYFDEFTITRANATYTVTYNSNGGTGTIANSTGASITLSDGTGFTAPSGYTFLEWNTAADGSGISYTASQSGVLSNLTLYAMWTQDGTIDDNGGTADGSYTVIYNSSTFTINTEPTYAGCSLSGYYDATSAGNLIATNAGVLQANTTYTDANGKWTYTGTAPTLYAQWIANYTVSFTPSNVTKTSGETEASSTADYTAVFSANSGYYLPNDITVTIGGSAQTKGTGYTWNVKTGTLTIPAAKVTGNIAITVMGVAVPTSWDFTASWNFSNEQIAAATEWNNSRGNAIALNDVALTVGGELIDVTAGLKFTVTNNETGKLFLTSGTYIVLGGGGAYVTVPNVAAGSLITVVANSQSNTTGAAIVAQTSNMTKVTGDVTTGETKHVFYVTSAGDCTFKRNGSQTINVYSITVKSASEIVSMPITSATWASFSNASEVAIPDGVTAYYASASDGSSSVTLKEITGGYIPANTGVVINGEAKTYYAVKTATSASLGGTNYLYAWTSEGTPNPGGDYYTLAVTGTTPVFKQSTGGTLAAGKSYLYVPGVIPARELTVAFGDSETTGINTVQGSGLKVNGEYYNLNGQRVAQPTRGLYIVNGKKVVIK